MVHSGERCAKSAPDKWDEKLDLEWRTFKERVQFVKIHESISRARKQAGMTQEQLAEAVGTNRRSVIAWEKGKQTPRSDKLLAICDALEITPGQLFPGNGEVLDLSGMPIEDRLQVMNFVEFMRHK